MPRKYTPQVCTMFFLSLKDMFCRKYPIEVKDNFAETLVVAGAVYDVVTVHEEKTESETVLWAGLAPLAVKQIQLDWVIVSKGDDIYGYITPKSEEEIGESF